MSMDIMYDIRSLLYRIIAVFTIWLLVRHKKEDLCFKFNVLISLLACLLVYYIIGSVICRYSHLGVNDFFWFSRLYNVAISTLFITIVFRFSPIGTEKNKLILFPRIAIKSTLYIAIQLFFFIIFAIIYINISRHSNHIFTDSSLLYQIDEGHYVAIIVCILTDLYAVIGEEMVFRYLAINTLRQALGNDMSLVLVSSALWVVMHTSLNFDLFILGIFIAYCYISTGYLSLCIFLHFAFNISVTSQSIYILLSRNTNIGFSHFQYAASVLIILIISYHLCEYLLTPKKSGQAI